MADVAIVAGYVVRCPLGGYAWQALHYLFGLKALGLDPYFYEDTAHYAACFDPATGEMAEPRPAALALAERVFAAHGFGDRWVFWDAQRDRYHGLDRERARDVLAGARLLLSLAAVNRLPGGVGRRRVFVDLDPGLTQITAQTDAQLAAVLDEHDVHFTIGENIGRPGCAVPTGRWEWQATRQPIEPALWRADPPAGDAPFTTIGRWDERRRVRTDSGVEYGWSKRDEWLRLIDLPRRSGVRLELAMDVDKTPGDQERLVGDGWRIVDPLAVSGDPDTYRRYIQASRGELSAAKELNVRLATGWFSDRSACYLAAGRPVVVQDTGFASTLPTGAGLLAFRTPDEAADLLREVEANWQLHSDAARRIAERYFTGRWVLAELLDRAGV